MAISIIAVGTAVQSASTSVSPVIPTSGTGGTVAADDFAVIWCGTASAGAPTTPSGWTLQNSGEVGAVSFGGFYTKKLVAGDLSSTVTITTGVYKANAHIIVVRGQDLTTPVDVAAAYATHVSGSGGTTLATPSVTPPTSGAFILGAAMDRGSPGSPTLTIGASATVQSTMTAQTGGGAVSSILVTANATGTGGSINADTATFGTTNLEKNVGTLALRPSATPATVAPAAVVGTAIVPTPTVTAVSPAALKLFIEWTAGTWTDVTADWDLSVQTTIHFGRLTPGDEPQPATLSLRLANPLGKYTPLRQVLADGVTTHPYYPNVTPRKRIKVSYNGTLFTGYIKGFPPGLENGVRGYVDIIATDILDQLSRVTLRAALLNQISLDSPIYSWPLTDAAGSTTAAEQSGNPVLQIPVLGSGVTFGGSGPGAGDGTGVNITTSAALLLTLPTPVPGPWTQEVFFNITTRPTGSVALLNWANLSSGKVVGPDSIGVGPTPALNTWHHVAIAAAANGSCILYLDGVSIGTYGAASVTVIGQVSMGGGDATSNINFGYATAYPTQLSATQVANHAAAADGYYGDTTGQRIARVLSWAGLTSASWNLDTGAAEVNTYPQAGQTVLGYCQDMATTEGGGAVFYVTPDGEVRFADRNYRSTQTVALTVDATQDLSNSNYLPAFDELSLINQVIVSRSSESGTDSTQTFTDDTSTATYGISSSGLTTYTTTDQDALSNAQGVVAANANPGFRFPQISVNLLTAVNNLYVAAAGVEIGDRIRLANIPAGKTPQTQADAIVEGWTITIAGGQQATFMQVFDTSPADNPARALWGTFRWAPVAGDMLLNAAITNSATSLAIKWTVGPKMTTTSGHYPFIIQIDEEQIQLNGVPGGSTSPQSWTGVTRGVNGTVAAAHSINSVISLAPGYGWTP